VSGPMGDKWKYRAALSYSDTDGYLDNTYRNDKADPYKDFSGRLRFTWDPTDKVSGDFRYSASHIDTTALYFVINDDYGLPPSATGGSAARHLAGAVVAEVRLLGATACVVVCDPHHRALALFHFVTAVVAYEHCLTRHDFLLACRNDVENSIPN